MDAWQVTKEYKYAGNNPLDHLGVDLVTHEKSPVVAAANGRVTFAGSTPEFGLRVVIDHENGWRTEYGQATLMVNYGDQVIKGQTIAIYGGESSSGRVLTCTSPCFITKSRSIRWIISARQ